MRLLIVTQAVDRNDPVLGFFHRWIEEFAKHFEKITVICLRQGDHDLPANVSVHSLGKETARGPRLFRILRYIAVFLRYVILLRREYDAVFVHMNAEYVILGGLPWRLLGKRILFWYNHQAGGARVRIAVHIAHRVFHTSPYAYTAGFRNAKRMPAGIDMSLFSPSPSVERRRNSILYAGRVAPAKRVHVLIDALTTLQRNGRHYSLDIVGAFADSEYEKSILARAGELLPKKVITFHTPVSHEALPSFYRRTDVFVNLTDAGNYDKVVLEAAACGALVVTSSPAFAFVDPQFTCANDANSVAQAMSRALSLEPAKRRTEAERMRAYVAENESLSSLASKMYAAAH